jgi:hypothetical protein
MLKTESDFINKFLREFTNQLIENSKPKQVVELQPIKKPKIPSEIKKLQKLESSPKKISFRQKIKQKFRKRKIPTQIPKLIIPDQKLPPKFQYLKPSPTKREIDLGKLNPLINNPATYSIECNGPDIPLKTRNRMGQEQTTNITLTKQEIKQIINKFQEITKIPALEGIYKVVAGDLIILAIISEIIGSKFIIKKMLPQQPPQHMLRMPQRRMPIKDFKNLLH